jgi:hypothetical protein
MKKRRSIADAAPAIAAAVIFFLTDMVLPPAIAGIVENTFVVSIMLLPKALIFIVDPFCTQKSSIDPLQILNKECKRIVYLLACFNMVENMWCM